MLKRIRELLTGRSKESADDILPVRPDDERSVTPAVPEVHKGPRVVHQPISKSDLDGDAVKIVGRLTRFDHSAYLVGGCVRDLLLERKPKDFDIGTSATPRQIKRLFRNSRIIGRRFRLAHIYFQNGKIIEVATFRGMDEDDSGDDGRERDLLIRDDNQFGSIEEDALRRDFTINSLFYDVNKGTVLDHADGLGDLRRRLVRTIGDPTIRFREDPIRILRAIKFAARLNFEIEGQTLKALRGARTEIPKAAPPRILEEINRFCRGGAARRTFELLRENEILEIIAPEVATRYRSVDGSWDLLLALLEALDGSAQNGGEVATGLILSILVLPVLLDDLGWKPDGKAVRPEGLDVRAVVDEVLRPLALRLRMARKDQEHCRHVVGTLYRMVPSRSVHRNTKRSILRRASLGDSLAILGVVAKELGGDFAEADRYWNSADRGSSDSAPKAPKAPGTPAKRKRQPARRDDRSEPPARRGRGGRGRRGDSRGDSSDKAPPAKIDQELDRPSDEKLPPVWDDDYFFAALPSVPETAAENIPDPPPPPEPEASQPPEENDRGPAAADGAAAVRPKRKRRPRRRRKPTAKKTESSSSNSDD